MQQKTPEKLQKIRFSIRSKLMLAMVAFTILFLASFAWVSIDGFESDKKASIYESILTNNSTLSALVTTELTSVREKVYIVLNGFNSQSRSFETLAKTAFNAATSLRSIMVFLPDSTEKLQLIGSLDRVPLTESETAKYLELAASAQQHEAAMSLNRQNDEWALALRFFDPSSKKYGAAVAISTQSKFVPALIPTGRTVSFLVDGDGHNLLSQSNILFNAISGWLAAHPPKSQSSSMQVKKIENDEESYLVSTAKLGIFDWAVVSAVPEKKAMAALSRLLITLGLILVIFVCMVIAASVLIAGGMTSNLSRLYQAVIAITKGELNTRTEIKSQDEIGVLGAGIDRMTERIRELIEDTKEKVRMEQELQTAQIVQSTLFPTEPLHLNNSEVHGYCLPASECSGDWWNCYSSGTKIYAAIGDATGHGVPAALVTSAARSAMALLAEFDHFNIAQRLTSLNQAIYATTKGQIQMTLFMCCLDTETGVLSYANASHDPPIYVPWTDKKLKRKELNVLTDVKGYRLGEKPDSQYFEATLQLNPGDVIVMTTDGISEMVGPNEEMFGERRFLKILLEYFAESRQLGLAIKTLNKALEEFRGSTALHDDVTLCLLRYQKEPTRAPEAEISMAETN